MAKFNKTVIGNSTLYLGDCLEVMKIIPDKSIDMILCDLPYGTTACKWDVIIPFEPLWEQYKRIIKDKGCIALFGSEPFSSYLRLSNIKWYKYDWIWKKNRAQDKMNAKNKPMPIHENISIFSNGVTANVKTNNKMIYYPQGIIKCNKIVSGTTGKWESTKRDSHKEKYVLENTNYPNSILVYKKDEQHFHNTQKPIALLSYLIKTYTKENEIVLDNSMGSGSTIVASNYLDRKSIGIEMDKDIFDLAIRRIKNPNIKESFEIKSKNIGFDL
jgi:site-specific DNA-methyltransferase (adenine-specific)